MKKLAWALALCAALVLCGCGAAPASGGAPAPIADTGFGSLRWGEGWDSLMESGEYATEIVQQGVAYGGYRGEAHYRFDEDGGLSGGCYLFDPGDWAQGTEVYRSLLDTLTGQYGAPADTSQGADENGAPIPSATIEEVTSAGEGGCANQWPAVEKAGDKSVYVTLVLTPSGRVTVTFSIG